MTPTETQATKEQAANFVAYLRTSTEPLQEVIKGRFEHTQYPLDFAYGVTLGAGLSRCECGKWDDKENLVDTDGGLLPCPHKGEQND